MHKTFVEFSDTAMALGIQKGAPDLAGHLQATTERLNELAKSGTEESDVEEDENDHGRSVQSVPAEPSSRRRGMESGPGQVSMLGYQATYGEEEEEEEEDAGEIAAPPAQLELDNNLPMPDWTGTENMQQLRSEGPELNRRSANNIRPVQRSWVNILDNNIEQFLRSKGLYLDGQFSEPFGPIDPSLGSEETSLPAVNSPYSSPSLNSSGGPHTPRSTDAHWSNEPNSSGNPFFWNETTNKSIASDMDMNEPLDGESIRF